VTLGFFPLSGWAYLSHGLPLIGHDKDVTFGNLSEVEAWAEVGTVLRKKARAGLLEVQRGLQPGYVGLSG
jgi:hypothetical protein